jgi:hypothetical protein
MTICPLKSTKMTKTRTHFFYFKKAVSGLGSGKTITDPYSPRSTNTDPTGTESAYPKHLVQVCNQSVTASS